MPIKVALLSILIHLRYPIGVWSEPLRPSLATGHDNRTCCRSSGWRGGGCGCGGRNAQWRRRQVATVPRLRRKNAPRLHQHSRWLQRQLQAFPTGTGNHHDALGILQNPLAFMLAAKTELRGGEEEWADQEVQRMLPEYCQELEKYSFGKGSNLVSLLGPRVARYHNLVKTGIILRTVGDNLACRYMFHFWADYFKCGIDQ